MKQTDFIKAGIVLFALIVVLAWVTVYNVDKINEQIGKLQGENTILKQNNDSLKASIQSMQGSLQAVSNQIDSLYLTDAKLAKQSAQTKIIIQKLQPKYEKAANRANRFNADSIRVYFSNLQ